MHYYATTTCRVVFNPVEGNLCETLACLSFKQKSDPQSMDLPNGLPQKKTFQMSLVGRIAIYILLLHIPCLFLSVWPLGAILSNCAG